MRSQFRLKPLFALFFIETVSAGEVDRMTSTTMIKENNGNDIFQSVFTLSTGVQTAVWADMSHNSHSLLAYVKGKLESTMHI